ncbi:MAG: glucose-1-phosphate cytidylyltransferase [Planctomycetota bacterium]
MNPAEVPVFILCGGLGTRLKEETGLRPKPMVHVGDRPILWHIMRWYGHYGFRRFVLCAGFKAEVIKSYFLTYSSMNSDFTIELKSNDVTVHSMDHLDDWEVTVANTGELTMTGGRIAKAVDRFLGGAEHFAVSYGDGLTDADLAKELQFHQSHGKIGTVMGVHPPSRFGEFHMADDLAVEFAEKPEFGDRWINAGFMFFRRDFRGYLSTDEDCVLERDPLVRLTKDGELGVYRHTGFWACMDTQRDMDSLNSIWDAGDAPWKA